MSLTRSPTLAADELTFLSPSTSLETAAAVSRLELDMAVVRMLLHLVQKLEIKQYLKDI